MSERGEPLHLLLAETFPPNTVPDSIHEVRFERPCIVKAFRIVSEGERPHPELKALRAQRLGRRWLLSFLAAAMDRA